MAYDSRQIANYFIRRANEAGRKMDIATVLKLVYIAHGWTLALLDRPLISDRVEAWNYGPVIPDVYAAFRKQGRFSKEKVFDLSAAREKSRKELEEDVEDVLSQVYDVYGDMGARHLSDLTHVPGGPWDIVMRAEGKYIPHDLIKDHYVKKSMAEQEA